MSNYHYDLNRTLEIDLTQEQEIKLFNEGYTYNESESSYDLYEEKFEDKKYFDFVYYKETIINSDVSEYEVYEKTKIIDVVYKTLEKEKGFTGFFVNIFNKIISKKEFNITDERLKQLELMENKKQINDLKIINGSVTKGVIKKLTDLEIKEYQKKGISYSFIRTTNEPKEEKVKIPVRKEGVEEKEFNEEYDGKYEIKIEKEYTKKVLKEKLIIDRREVIEQTQYMYIPGIWSMTYNHKEGTEADFKGEILIKTISGFNIFDEEFINHEEIKEQIIEIIEDEHGMAQFIRNRDDKKDGFNIESSKLV